LGRRISERVSVLRKIESGKLEPELALAERLEHTLKIKLRVPPEDPKAQLSKTSKPQGTTLGDLIKIKFKEEEAEK
jgi:putative transcription factor